MSLLAPLHPAVQKWFAESLGEPTPPQREGWPPIREGRNTLIAAPTGSGKTLAAFLSAIDALIRQGALAQGRDAGPLRLAAARALERRPEKPPGTARGDPRAGSIGTRDPRPRPDGRHVPLRARRDVPPAAPHPRHDAGIALPSPDERGRPKHPPDGLDGHRRRDPRARPRQTRQPPRALPRAPRAPRRPTDPARRPLGDAEASRRGRPLSRGCGARVHPRRRRDVPGAGPRDRDPAVAACDGLLARAVGGDLRADRRSRARAPHDARLREHPQDGRANLGPAHAPPRGGRRHEPPREPLEGAPAGRRTAPEGRHAAGARRDRLSGARNRRRRRGPRDPGRRDALDRDVPAARRPRRPRAAQDPEGAALPSHARRARGRGRPSRGDPPLRPRPDAHAAAPARHPGPADRRRGRGRGVGRACPLRPRPESLAVPGPLARGLRPRRRTPHGRAARTPAPRRRERPSHGDEARPSHRPHVRWRNSRHGGLPGPARAGRHARRNRQRGLGRRVERRRHLPARQRVVARPSRRDGHRARRGREGPAAVAPVLARRGPRPHARARGGDRKDPGADRRRGRDPKRRFLRKGRGEGRASGGEPFSLPVSLVTF